MTNSKWSFYAAVLLLLLNSTGCKKTKVGALSFSTGTVSLDAVSHPSETVTIQLSEPVNEVAEIDFEVQGPDDFKFGSIAATFLNDDSNRIEALINGATITPPMTDKVAHV